VNYYEHHIGDYAEATAHLSFVEDAAYSRLIRKYYAQEKPLPADLKAVQRLVGARTKEEKEAVDSVLQEFFILADDGWHNKRCDAEVARYQEKQRKAKASAEARWSKTNSQTERNANAMRTHAKEDANASGEKDADAMRTHSEGNAHQTPSTRHQSPDTSQNHRTASDDSTGVGAGASPGEISKAMRAGGVQSQPADPRIIALSQQGVTVETVQAACAEAKAAKPNESIGVGYVVAIIQRWAKEAASIQAAGAQAPTDKPKQAQDTWWTSDAGIDRKGRELGLRPLGTENYASYKDRIFEEIRKRQNGGGPQQSAA
jgi:uncharacterized protein YdaU (DUF1376 family)